MEGSDLKIVIRISCILSMIGSALVVFTWAFPRENRHKPGRILLMWLSVADFLSSFFYIIQTFDSVVNNESLCEALSLLDIYFPVASFLWTDFISYYLYLIVHYRSVHFTIPWNRLFMVFHAITWLGSLLIILLVWLTNHAGNNSAMIDDDNTADNTAGWCWIEANSKHERFVWEVIGGKFVEWISGLIIIPFFYISVARKLYNIDRRRLPIEGLNGGPMKSLSGSSGTGLGLSPALQNSRKAKSSALSSSASIKQNDDSGEHGNFVLTSAEVQNVLSLRPSFIKTLSSTNSDIDTSTSHTVGDGGDYMYQYTRGVGRMGYEDASVRDGHLDYEEGGDRVGDDVASMSTVSIEDGNAIGMDEDDEDYEMSRRVSATGKYFNRFYLKLFLLPLVFISIRFWSSLRILLSYYNQAKYANNGFLVVMQAFFDPSQGFFNSILFVFFSKSDRTRLFSTFEHIGKWIVGNGRSNKPKYKSVSDVSEGEREEDSLYSPLQQ